MDVSQPCPADGTLASVAPTPTRHTRHHHHHHHHHHHEQQQQQQQQRHSNHPNNYHHPSARQHAARIPRRHSPQGPGFGPSTSSSDKLASIPPASPEVISSLITSLSVVSQPASTRFDSHSSAEPSSDPGPGPGPGSDLDLPASPRSCSNLALPSPTPGSFGVDYGAYNRPGRDGLTREPVSLDELAASPPVVRTSKPPSGFSPLTAPNRTSSHDSVSGLRSFIRTSSTATSRPSSRGSLNSNFKNDDSQSIGNLSIERGSVPTHNLRTHRSHDSWGRKANRGSKGHISATSKERLHDKDLDRKRTSGNISASVSAPASAPGPGRTLGHTGAAAAATAAAACASNSLLGGGASPSPGPSFTRTPLSEETGAATDGPATSRDKTMGSPKTIPERDSSLKNMASRRKRAKGARRSKRDSEGALGDAIFETEEHGRGREASGPRHGPSQLASHDMIDKSFLLGLEDEFPLPPKATTPSSKQIHEGGRFDEFRCYDDGAPYPSVSGGRHRDEHSDERSVRRLSGRQSPGPKDVLKLKRSSTRLKRLSAGPMSPRSPPSESRPGAVALSETPPRHATPAGYERPGSADSVDDAVESYLCSSRLSQKIRHPQTGRLVSFSEVGDANGSAVFCCVGMGLTRYITAFYDELAFTLKLRLITPDRPGVGDSEPYSDGTATPLSWPDDVYAICQALKITKFSILAHSAGAIYALATALRMPQHIRGRIHLLAPWIPPSQMNVFGSSQTMPPTNAIPTSQKILRALPTPILRAANSSFMTATSSSITSSLPKNPRRARRKATPGKEANSTPNRNLTAILDGEAVGGGGHGRDGDAALNGESGLRPPNATENMDRMQPPQGALHGSPVVLTTAADVTADKERQVTYDTRLTHAIWELATTGANPAVDLLVCLERRHTIGFRYVDITRPVVIHHGSRDTRVPVENVKWLGKTMRRCEVRVLEGEGHGLMASAAVMGSVLMEMSKEWEDWMRATGADGRKDRERGRRGPPGGR